MRAVTSVLGCGNDRVPIPAAPRLGDLPQRLELVRGRHALLEELHLPVPIRLLARTCRPLRGPAGGARAIPVAPIARGRRVPPSPAAGEGADTHARVAVAMNVPTLAVAFLAAAARAGARRILPGPPCDLAWTRAAQEGVYTLTTDEDVSSHGREAPPISAATLRRGSGPCQAEGHGGRRSAGVSGDVSSSTVARFTAAGLRARARAAAGDAGHPRVGQASMRANGVQRPLHGTLSIMQHARDPDHGRQVACAGAGQVQVPAAGARCMPQSPLIALPRLLRSEHPPRAPRRPRRAMRSRRDPRAPLPRRPRPRRPLPRPRHHGRRSGPRRHRPRLLLCAVASPFSRPICAGTRGTLPVRPGRCGIKCRVHPRRPPTCATPSDPHSPRHIR